MSGVWAPRAWLAVLAWALLALAHGQTPAGTQVVNQARATFGAQATSVPSNQVTSEVLVICEPSISPQSTSQEPVQSMVTLAGQAVSIPFRLSNGGNGTFLLDLSAVIEPGAGWTPASVTLYRDVEANGRLDPGDPEVVAVELAPRQSVALLMTVTPAAGATGTILISPAARCPESASVNTTQNQAAGSFSRIRVLSASSPVINTELRLRDLGSTNPAGVSLATTRQRIIEVTVATTNRGGDASTQAGESEAASVTLPLDTVAGCFVFQSAGSDSPNAEVEVLMDTSWVSPLRALALMADGVSSTNRARAIRMRLAALAGGEIAELIALFELDEQRCPNQLPSLQTEASVPGPDGYTTSNIGFAEILPQRGASLTFVADTVDPQTLTRASTGLSVALGDERCFPLRVSNTGDTFDSYRLLLSASVPTNRRQAVQVALQNSANLPIDSQLGLEDGETLEVLVCLTVLEPVGPFELQARLLSDGGADTVSARLRVGAIVEAAALGVLLEAAPTGLVAAGGLINFVASVHNDFDIQITDVIATMGVISAVGPDGAVIDDAVEISMLDSGLVFDAELGLIRWQAGNIEPGFSRRVQFQLRVSDNLPEGSRLQTVMNATSGGVGRQFVSPIVEHLVWAGGVTLEVEAIGDPVAPGSVAEILLLARNPSDRAVDLELQVQADAVVGIERVRRSLDGGVSWTTAAGLTASLAPGEQAQWRVAMRVHPSARGEIAGLVTLTVDSVDPRLRETLVRGFQIRIEPGVFERDQGLLFGFVYLDRDGDGRYRAGIDQPLAGVRVLLADGRQVVSDAQGQFAFRDLAMGWWRLQFDPATIPTRIAPMPERQSDHAVRVWVQGITRIDVPLSPLALSLEGGVFGSPDADPALSLEVPWRTP